MTRRIWLKALLAIPGTALIAKAWNIKPRQQAIPAGGVFRLDDRITGSSVIGGRMYVFTATKTYRVAFHPETEVVK